MKSKNEIIDMIKSDVNSSDLHPSRYDKKDDEIIAEINESNSIECWTIMKFLLKFKTFTSYQGYLFGCAFKYLWRLGEKDDPKKEIEKCINYLNKLKDSL